MISLWNESESATFDGGLALRVYASRLLGEDPSLVLHGGGNTSVKVREKNLFGEEQEVLYVKGTGQNLAVIEESGFTPVRRDALLKLLELADLPDADLKNELSLLVMRADALAPSIETFLHAIFPHQYVDHTHSDAVLAISNTDDGEERIREIYGGRVIIVPYTKPGFTLAKVFQQKYSEASAEIEGVVLMHHGVFSFGDSARASYEKMIELVDMAEKYLVANGAWELSSIEAKWGDVPRGALMIRMASLRKDISDAAGSPLILSARGSERCHEFARRKDVSFISQQGPATPDHVLRTRRIPMVGIDVRAYAKSYENEFKLHAPSCLVAEDMLDPAPRVVLDTELGLCSAGRSALEAAMAGDIYEQTVDLILRAETLGGYRALSAMEIFEVEYWALERSKLAPVSKMFAGEVALVTGAASGIGKACVESLMARGAAVVGLDLSPEIESIFETPEYLGLVCDVTSDEAISEALEQAVSRFGGIDMVVLNAGIFPASREISEISSE
ncbi:MAG: SDR family NAD(P)-dependent oxidoreductase, partial [Nitrospinaceae bacterium]|nr:SDR family NAD(P)-dependent oxidoreductase [Nitrospinaceae bacterium]